MTASKKLLLARVQEVAQIYADRVVWYVVSPLGKELRANDREELIGQLNNVTAALGRHTMAVLGELDANLGEHLTTLFDRLAALEALCDSLGAPTMPGIFESYQERLLVSEREASAA